METTITTPASCELRAVTCFLHAEGQSAAEIHRRLCRVYGDNVMSYSSVREWCRKFRDGRGCSVKALFSCTTMRSPTPRLAQML